MSQQYDFGLDQLETTLPGNSYLGSANFPQEIAKIIHAERFCAVCVEGLNEKGTIAW